MRPHSSAKRREARLRTLIVGAGAVGGFFGARLARGSNEVVFQARGAHLEALRNTGLRVESERGTLELPVVDAVASPRGRGPFELVLVATKAQDAAPAIEGLAGELARGATLLSLQNGIESEGVIERALGISEIPRAVAYVGAELIAPGVIRHSDGGSIVAGELSGERSARLERLEVIARRSGFELRISNDIRRVQWQKLAWNASLNLVTAISGLDSAAVLATADGRALVEAAMTEVRTVARKEGIEIAVEHLARVLEWSAERPVRPSTLQDRLRGRPLEHDALTGAVVRFGERHGVPTPVCRTLDALARLLSS